LDSNLEKTPNTSQSPTATALATHKSAAASTSIRIAGCRMAMCLQLAGMLTNAV
jgi:hypothetical protein